MYRDFKFECFSKYKREYKKRLILTSEKYYDPKFPMTC